MPELAAGGTLFLDEVGDRSAPVPVELLRVLQEREYERVGGTATLKADIRLIAATNRDLNAEMAAARFRRDLSYRLSVFDVHLPALRERDDDVLLLVDSFIRALAANMGKGDVTLSRDACEMLRRHPWPGNVRELQNAIERRPHHVRRLAGHGGPPRDSAERGTRGADGGHRATAPGCGQRNAILDGLARAHGHKLRAAALLGRTRLSAPHAPEAPSHRDRSRLSPPFQGPRLSNRLSDKRKRGCD